MLHILQQNPRLDLNAKELKLQFTTLKEIQLHCAINLPVPHLPTSGKQLISSYLADQNQAMLYNINLLPDNISVVVGIISQGRHTHWILTRKIKNLHRMLV